jgi:hypothetical protein
MCRCIGNTVTRDFNILLLHCAMLPALRTSRCISQLLTHKAVIKRNKAACLHVIRDEELKLARSTTHMRCLKPSSTKTKPFSLTPKYILHGCPTLDDSLLLYVEIGKLFDQSNNCDAAIANYDLAMEAYSNGSKVYLLKLNILRLIAS